MIDPLIWPAVMAAAAALGGGAMARWVGLRALGAGLAALGLLIGLVALLGALQASPRQLFERLPMLALGLLALAILAARWPRLAWPAIALATFWAGWWMAGAPLWWPDMQRAAFAALLMAGGALAAMLALRLPWQAALLGAGLAGMLWASAPRGPWFEISWIVAAAGIAAAAFGSRLPLAMALVLGPVLAATALGPVLAIGRGADWAVPLALLLAGAIGLLRLPLAGRLAAQCAMLAAAMVALRLG